MSLARLRDETRKPFRVGAHVTVQSAQGNPWEGTIAGSLDDYVRVQDQWHQVHLVGVDDITF